MRIRTIKPEMFRHELLQEVEANNPGKCTILVFQGLISACDSQGVFEWRPRQLKLDIWPFLTYDMAETLEILRTNGFVEKFEADGRLYGVVPSFAKHQRISGKEVQDGRRYPAPPSREANEKQPGSNREADEQNENFSFAQEHGTGNMEHGKDTQSAREDSPEPNTLTTSDLTDVAELWNSLGLPKWRQLPVVLPNVPQIGEVMQSTRFYTKAEIVAAMRNYGEVVHHREKYTWGASYGSVWSFLSKGIPTFEPGAFETLRKPDARAAPESGREIPDAQATRDRIETMRQSGASPEAIEEALGSWR